MTGFVVATLVTAPAGCPGDRRGPRRARPWSGLVNGIGVGVFRVHPLIMTLGMSLVVLGPGQRLAAADGPDGAGVPQSLSWLGSGTLVRRRARTACSCSSRSRSLILLGLRRTGYGRLLYAIGDNPIAARLSGARSWQVLIVLYVISALLAAVAGLLISGFTNTASVTLVDPYLLPSVAAAVIGGTSIMGGRGGYRRNDRRRADPDGAHGAPDGRSGSPSRRARSCSGRSSSLVAAAYTRVTAEA